eukprot:m.242483 g.242483  ORF g.242483 m.242483 type:complete len:59 (+) comp40219_c0_seq82:1550-1726(+)
MSSSVLCYSTKSKIKASFDIRGSASKYNPYGLYTVMGSYFSFRSSSTIKSTDMTSLSW